MKFIKDFSLKKNIKNTLTNYKAPVSGKAVVTVGVLLDETYFAGREDLIKEIASYGINARNIETLSFFERVKKKELPQCCHFSYADVTSGGEFAKEDVTAFINKSFDLLISYYDVQKPPLALITLKSKAAFKAGFSTTDSRFHTFMVASQVEKYKEFTAELFKYLKILNKL
ncbi:DUF6913 domain-containing protein [Flavobacterium sp. RHBU_3]|uniref:DUF6913 domain-containing protein n=1 Tax=Flavobacterium sp. RHBU_3 TaxID=3391184 RepID=UPI00398543E7